MIVISDVRNDLNNRVVELLSDGASTMTAMVLDELQRKRKLFPKAVHIRCTAHKLHNLACKVSEAFTELNDVMMGAKSIFVKSKRRRRFFKRFKYNRPPKVIPIRWGSWLKATKFYSDRHNVESLRTGLIALHDIESKQKVYSNSTTFVVVRKSFCYRKI